MDKQGRFTKNNVYSMGLEEEFASNSPALTTYVASSPPKKVISLASTISNGSYKTAGLSPFLPSALSEKDVSGRQKQKKDRRKRKNSFIPSLRGTPAAPQLT